MRNLIIISLFFYVSCTGIDNSEKKFSLLSPENTHIDFSNELKFDKDFNIYTYRNFYNGGGVGLGDFNNDGWLDVYFTANMTSNKLYVNKGNWSFEDITESSNAGGNKAWSAGVSIVDINADGWLDIYVCNSGDVKGDNKQNELFINNGNLTFSEKAKEYGLANTGYSTHAAFFDYDRDGDLDMYLLNNSYQAIGSFNLKINAREDRDNVGGDKLFRNDDGHFTDISEEAGIYGSIIGFGLGVTVGDVNRDGWMDIYVSNDFFERDYLYINNRDGTFKEKLTDEMRSISGASMGADMADINNDGYPDLFVTEMLPKEDSRLKTKTTFENWDKYQYNVKNGYYHQFTRNMFQLNNGDDTFSEIGRMNNLHATDWSWGALMADFDNNGYIDIFVANGIYQDLTDQDYLNYIANEETIKAITSNKEVDYARLIEAIPSNKISNFLFANEGGREGFLFQEKTKEWNLDQPSYSNGSAYGDLDNDGDLDLVVNNVNMMAFVYENNTISKEQANTSHFLSLNLKGEGGNSYALGATVVLISNGKKWYKEHLPIRGFQSSVDYKVHFGLGNVSHIDTVIINWPNGYASTLTDISTDQILNIDIKEQILTPGKEIKNPKDIYFSEITSSEYIDFTHHENPFVDFDRDNLLIHMKSTEGPCFCQTDLNNDGKMDIYIGGAKDQPGALMLQGNSGVYDYISRSTFYDDRISEDTDCKFFDADGDGDMDLYVTSGGNEFPLSSSALADRLYLNQGSSEFKRSDQILPAGKFESSSTIDATDFDGDGDQDLLVGIRMLPFSYGLPTNLYILENDGKGYFTNITDSLAPEFQKIGMITDAIWTDLNQDDKADILAVGEWMSPKVFEWTINGYNNITQQINIGENKGWWKTIEEIDVDKDGDLDFILGNTGLNSRMQASMEKPIKLYINDFDSNGQLEHIYAMYEGKNLYPIALKHDLIKQLPGLNKDYLQYANYAGKQIDQIFSEKQLSEAIALTVNTLSSSILVNNGDQNWEVKSLPLEVQVSPVYAIKSIDINKDGNMDLIIGGNLFNVKPEIGRYDASYGQVLFGSGEGIFKMKNHSGIIFEGEVRSIDTLTISGTNYVIAIRNNDSPQLFKIKR